MKDLTLKIKRYANSFRFQDPNIKKIYLLLIIQAIFEGITNGIFVLYDVIAKKGLDASDIQITIITILIHTGFIAAVFFGYFTKGKKKGWYYFASMILGRLIFLSAFLLNGINIYIIYVFMFFTFSSLQSPGINAIFQNSFPVNIRGKLFSLLRVILSILSMITTFVCGRLLDIKSEYFKIILIAGGILGSISFLILIMIDKKVEYKGFDITFKFKEMFPMLLKKSKDFLVFEILFMIYGFGFMFMLPIVPIYLVDNMNFSYSQMALAKGPLTQIFIILFLPLAGVLFDRINPWKIFKWVQLLLIFFPLSFLFADIFVKSPIMIYTGFLFLSLGLAGITLVWNLASIYFAKENDSTLYQSLHVTFTGIRGFFAPLLSFIIFSFLGFRIAFIISAMFYLTAFLGTVYYLKIKGPESNR